MDKINNDRNIINMPSRIRTTRWLTAKTLHQIQILSCDLCDLVQWDSPDFCAPFWRLYWHDGYGAWVSVEGKNYHLKPRQLTLIPPNTHFAAELRRPVRQLFIHFLLEPGRRNQTGAILQFPAGAAQSTCRSLTRLLLRDNLDVRCSFLAQKLVAEALEASPVDQWSSRFEDPRVTRAVAAIHRGYPAALTNSTLARSAGMHPSAFGRLFRTCTGHAPREFLTHLRLEEACTLLHYEDASLDEIADKTGFNDRGYFSRVFTRHFGCSPARYRRLVNVSERLRPGA